MRSGWFGLFASTLLVGALSLVGCARIEALRGGSAKTDGATASAEPEDTTPELSFASDAKWRAFASSQPLTTAGRSDVQVGWARPNYGTSSWKPALIATSPTEDAGSLSGAAWMWYPQDGFKFGGTNQLPDNRHIVHFRRVFYNNLLRADIKEALVSVMPSGKLTMRVFLNGYELKTDDEEMFGRTSADRQQRSMNRMRQQMSGEYEMMDRQERKYALRDKLVVGKNVLAIEATAHINNDVGGRPVPNYVRSGVAVKTVIR